MYHFFKRFFDIFLCSIALIVLIPLFLITAIGIKVSSKGPVFYCSTRVKKKHKDFVLYKFRSMHVTNNDKGLFIADEERLFWFGKLIRKLKIDEIPQLINVIKGDMSIVGPRPMPAKTVDLIYSGKYQDVLNINPGLTSVASLYDYVVGETFDDNDLYTKEVLPIKRELELYYLKNESFSYDAYLVAKTIIVIIASVFRQQRKIRFKELERIDVK